MRSRKDGSPGFANGCYEVVHHAAQIWRRVIQGKESPRVVAQELGLSAYSVGRMCSACRQVGGVPSQRRLALCVMHQPDITDQEIAEMFGRNEKWVMQVRSDAARLRREEPIKLQTEYMDEGLRPEDPTLEQIRIRAEICRMCWRDGLEGTKEIAQ